jgi:hypothetical protein
MRSVYLTLRITIFLNLLLVIPNIVLAPHCYCYRPGSNTSCYTFGCSVDLNPSCHPDIYLNNTIYYINNTVNDYIYSIFHNLTYADDIIDHYISNDGNLDTNTILINVVLDILHNILHVVNANNLLYRSGGGFYYLGTFIDGSAFNIDSIGGSVIIDAGCTCPANTYDNLAYYGDLANYDGRYYNFTNCSSFGSIPSSGGNSSYGTAATACCNFCCGSSG